jgi:hypothetical protein
MLDQDTANLLANRSGDELDWLTGIDNADASWIASRLGQKPPADLLYKRIPLAFHAVPGTLLTFRTNALLQIEDEGEVGEKLPRSKQADVPQLLRRQPSRMPLVNDRCQEEAVTHDGFAASQGGLDYLLNELRSAGHVQVALAQWFHFTSSIEQQLTNAIAYRS